MECRIAAEEEAVKASEPAVAKYLHKNVAGLRKDLHALRKKEDRLRKEKEQLRKKEDRLRKEKEQLRNKEDRLRRKKEIEERRASSGDQNLHACLQGHAAMVYY